MYLMTFGCSWTFGIGAAWEPGMSKDELEKLLFEDESRNASFRTLISKQLNLENVNFGIGGSSNHYQFRSAREWFTKSENIERIKDNGAIVLWGITSIYRNEAYDPLTKQYKNFLYHVDHPGTLGDINKFFFKYLHDDDNEIKTLTENMLLWNRIFSSLHIPVIYFDTFNKHTYNRDIPNLIRPDDILTMLLSQEGISVEDDEYHTSAWKIDSEKIRLAVEHELVNPYSNHPTRHTHEKIANLLIPYIEKKLK